MFRFHRIMRNTKSDGLTALPTINCTASNSVGYVNGTAVSSGFQNNTVCAIRPRNTRCNGARLLRVNRFRAETANVEPCAGRTFAGRRRAYEPASDPNPARVDSGAESRLCSSGHQIRRGVAVFFFFTLKKRTSPVSLEINYPSSFIFL